jgi:hypothetical protein
MHITTFGALRNIMRVKIEDTFRWVDTMKEEYQSQGTTTEPGITSEDNGEPKVESTMNTEPTLSNVRRSLKTLRLHSKKRKRFLSKQLRLP